MKVERCDLHADCVVVRETQFSKSVHLDYDGTVRMLYDLKTCQSAISRRRASERARALHQQRTAEVVP